MPRMIGATHHVVEQENRQNHHRERDGAEHPEHGAPAPRVYEEAADGRADGGREPDDHAHDGRGLAVLAFRVDVQRHQLHERQADAGAAGLQQARRQQAGIVRREDGRSAPDGERRHGREEQLLGIEPVHQIARHGADQAQHEDVCRGEQLAGACADAVLVHDRRQRGDHHALGDARRRGARHHDAQHHTALPQGQAVALGFGVGFGSATAAGAAVFTRDAFAASSQSWFRSYSYRDGSSCSAPATIRARNAHGRRPSRQTKDGEGVQDGCSENGSLLPNVSPAHDRLAHRQRERCRSSAPYRSLSRRCFQSGMKRSMSWWNLGPWPRSSRWHSSCTTTYSRHSGG